MSYNTKPLFLGKSDEVGNEFEKNPLMLFNHITPRKPTLSTACRTGLTPL